LADVINRLLVEYSQCLAEVESGTGGEFSIVNPLFFTRRITVSQAIKNGSASFYRSKQPYLVQQTIEDQLHAVAEVKGSSVTPIRTASSSMPLKKEPPVLEGQKLQNEFFVATIDSKTGALQSILYHGQRGNLASQRLVLVDKGSNAVSTMVCDEIEPVAVNHLSGEIKTSGRIVVGDEAVANFTQVFRLRRGQQVLELEIDIRPTIGLENSKRKYFAHRLAWRDEASKVFGSDQFVRSELYAPKFESPNFVDIENLDYGLTLLPGGLPYHQRIERRQLETLLIVGKESRRAFKVGIGVDLKYPLKSAFDLASPALIAKSGSAAAQQFFHLDSRNVLVTYARPFFDSADGAWGMEMRLQETQRRGGEVSLFTPLKMSQVYRTNFDGDVIETLHDAEAAAVTQIRLPHAAADYFQIRIVFALG